MFKIDFRKLFYSSLFIAVFYLFLGQPKTVDAQAFRFVAWGDTRGNNTVLTSLSKQVKALSPQPALTVYPGDLIPTNSPNTPLVRFQLWKTALDGGVNNGLSNITFASRGNHDLPDTAAWTSFFQFGPVSDPNSIAAKVGVTNYQALSDDLTYSFDYPNSHFIAVDSAGNASQMTSAQIAWVDQDLTQAQSRGLKHAFIFYHGPNYTVNGHMSGVPTALMTVLNKHSILSASIHGHEHVVAHTTIDSSRISQITNFVFEQLVVGNAGAGVYSCTAGRSDYCQNYFGFTVVDVLSDTQFKVSIYKDGVTTSQWERTFTKGNNPPSTVTPTKTPTPKATNTPTPTPKPGTPTPTPTKKPTPTGSFIQGDIDGDGDVDIFDYNILVENFGNTNCGSVADIDGNCKVDIFDYNLLITNFGRTSGTPTPTTSIKPTPTSSPSGSFNFISWSDTEKSLTTFGQISNQALALQPEFTFYNGDAGLGFPDQWKAALNGNNNNGMADRTFATRGNGDSSGYASAFNFQQVAASIQASNYTALVTNLTYSFDYGNSRFVSLDNPGCMAATTTQLGWLEERIKDAVNRGLTHVFLFKHGPIWYVDNHPNCTPPAGLVSLISNYPIVTALFTGHEHMKSHIPFGPSDNRISMPHPFHQIITAPAGGGTYPCNSSRLTGANDYCASSDGFANISVSGRTVNVSFYQAGNTTPIKTISFTK